MKEYALYNGDELLAFGTIKEISKQLNIREDSIRRYGTKCYKKNKKDLQNIRILIEIED